MEFASPRLFITSPYSICMGGVTQGDDGHGKFERIIQAVEKLAQLNKGILRHAWAIADGEARKNAAGVTAYNYNITPRRNLFKYR